MMMNSLLGQPYPKPGQLIGVMQWNVLHLVQFLVQQRRKPTLDQKEQGQGIVDVAVHVVSMI